MRPRIVVATVVALVVLAASAAGQTAPAPTAAAPTTSLAYTARITDLVTARARPGTGHSLGYVDSEDPYWGGPNVLLVLDTATVNDKPYLKVLLKRRPSGTAGWIPASAAKLATTRKRVIISISKRILTLQSAGKNVATTRAVVGKHSTPTPVGQFSVDAIVRQPSGSDLGPRVIAVTAFSDVMKSFGGGLPQMGIHGYEALGDPLGSARSHGCVRVPAATIRLLVAKLPRGAPVLVRR